MGKWIYFIFWCPLTKSKSVLCTLHPTYHGSCHRVFRIHSWMCIAGNACFENVAKTTAPDSIVNRCENDSPTFEVEFPTCENPEKEHQPLPYIRNSRRGKCYVHSLTNTSIMIDQQAPGTQIRCRIRCSSHWIRGGRADNRLNRHSDRKEKGSRCRKDEVVWRHLSIFRRSAMGTHESSVTIRGLSRLARPS